MSDNPRKPRCWMCGEELLAPNWPVAGLGLLEVHYCPRCEPSWAPYKPREAGSPASEGESTTEATILRQQDSRSMVAQAFLEGMKRAIDLLLEHDTRWYSNTEAHREDLLEDLRKWKEAFERANSFRLRKPVGWIGTRIGKYHSGAEITGGVHDDTSSKTSTPLVSTNPNNAGSPASEGDATNPTPKSHP